MIVQLVGGPYDGTWQDHPGDRPDPVTLLYTEHGLNQQTTAVYFPHQVPDGPHTGRWKLRHLGSKP